MKCEVCGKNIPKERLKILPDTQLCVKHAEEAQKFGGEFKLTGVQGNLGKAGSLKKNYGDVDVYKTRNNDAVQKVKDKNNKT